MRCWFEDYSFIKIDYDVSGMANWLGWKGTIAKSAVFESTHCAPAFIVIGTPYLTLVRLTLICC